MRRLKLLTGLRNATSVNYILNRSHSSYRENFTRRILASCAVTSGANQSGKFIREFPAQNCRDSAAE